MWEHSDIRLAKVYKLCHLIPFLNYLFGVIIYYHIKAVFYHQFRFIHFVKILHNLIFNRYGWQGGTIKHSRRDNLKIVFYWDILTHNPVIT